MQARTIGSLGICVNAYFLEDPMLREDEFSLHHFKKVKKYAITQRP
jgi:hypothetical protein